MTDHKATRLINLKHLKTQTVKTSLLFLYTKKTSKLICISVAVTVFILLNL